MKTFTLCLHFVLALTLVCFVPCRLAAEEVDSLESDTASRWQGVCLSRASPTPPESAATVKSLIKSFDLGCSGIWTLYFVVKEFLAVSRTCFLLLEGCFLSVHGCGRSLQWPSVVPWSDKRVIVGFEIQIFFSIVFPLFFPLFFLAGSSGQNIPVHKVPRSPLSGIPVRTAPAAAVSPMQVQGALLSL